MHHPLTVIAFVLATAVACTANEPLGHPSNASPGESRSAPRTAPRFEPQTNELPGRVALEYVEQGDASGVPVILLHGYSDSWHSFELVLPTCRRGCTCSR